MSCGVGCRLGSDPALLWLWRRPMATAPIRPLAWEPPCAAAAAQEMAKRQKNKQTKKPKPKTKKTSILITSLSVKLWHEVPYLLQFTVISFHPSIFFFFSFLLLHLQHLEIPRPGVESELQLQAYTTVTVTLDPSHICHLHHSLWQCQILNPLSEARD